jgi:biotin carboxyl carrier protein
MKMETPVPATDPGTVQAVLVKAGDRVEVGQELVRIG